MVCTKVPWFESRSPYAFPFFFQQFFLVLARVYRVKRMGRHFVNCAQIVHTCTYVHVHKGMPQTPSLRTQ